jgi:hypothetical protein
MNNPPCYKCESRKVGCHSECERYKEYQSSRKVLNYTIYAKKQEERDIAEFRLGKKNKK